jgi:hypothetical protein
VTHKCDHPYADSLCGRYAKHKLWNKLTGDTVHRCRTHADILCDADSCWMDIEIADEILKRDGAVSAAKNNLRVAAERIGHDARPRWAEEALEALYDAARKLVAAEIRRKEILRDS